jgi:hypothetical protein
MQQGRFAAWGPPRPPEEAQRARANDHPTHSSANLGPQAIAACSEKHPMPRQHQVNAIRMIKAGPIVKLKYHTQPQKSKICGRITPENCCFCREADAARPRFAIYV